MADIIVAGNTSGAITISAPLVAGSGVLTLPTGTDTLVGKATTDTLTNKSIAATQLTGTIAAGRLPAGSVIQVVNATFATAISTTSVTYVDTGLSLAITPSSASNKVLAIANCNGLSKGTSTNLTGSFRLVRAATSIITFEDLSQYTGTTAAMSGEAATSYLDSPATTSSVTYKVQYATSAGTLQMNNFNGATGSTTSTITLMEIAG